MIIFFSILNFIFWLIGLIICLIVFFYICGEIWDKIRYKFNLFNCREKWLEKYKDRNKSFINWLFSPEKPWKDD